MQNLSNKAIAAVAIVTASILGLTQFAHADAVSDAFTAIGTSATTTIGLGVALLITVMTLGVGVKLLLKFVKRTPAAAT